jgi:tetratricopeptide (TPR) repeat protein
MQSRLSIWFLAGVLTAPVMGQVKADSAAVWIAVGDSLTDRWDHKQASKAYMTALRYDPTNYEAMWKAGDQTTEVADAMPAKLKAEKESLFEWASTICRKAISIKPDDWEGHFRLAVAQGRLALFRGGKEKIKLANIVKVQADSAVALNPKADLAYHVLGRWHQDLANLSGTLKFFAKILFGGVPPGSNEESVAMFKKAIEINPNHIEHYLELARTYKFMDRKDLMKEPLEKVLSLPNVEEKDPGFKKEAEEMLKDIR